MDQHRPLTLGKNLRTHQHPSTGTPPCLTCDTLRGYIAPTPPTQRHEKKKHKNRNSTPSTNTPPSTTIHHHPQPPPPPPPPLTHGHTTVNSLSHLIQTLNSRWSRMPGWSPQRTSTARGTQHSRPAAAPMLPSPGVLWAWPVRGRDGSRPGSHSLAHPGCSSFACDTTHVLLLRSAHSEDEDLEDDGTSQVSISPQTTAQGGLCSPPTHTRARTHLFIRSPGCLRTVHVLTSRGGPSRTHPHQPLYTYIYVSVMRVRSVDFDAKELSKPSTQSEAES